MLKGALGEGESERKARRLREREGESERRREKQGEDTANEVEKGTKRRLKKVVLLKKNLKTPGEITALKNVRERKRERPVQGNCFIIYTNHVYSTSGPCVSVCTNNWGSWVI